MQENTDYHSTNPTLSPTPPSVVEAKLLVYEMFAADMWQRLIVLQSRQLKYAILLFHKKLEQHYINVCSIRMESVLENLQY